MQNSWNGHDEILLTRSMPIAFGTCDRMGNARSNQPPIQAKPALKRGLARVSRSITYRHAHKRLLAISRPTHQTAWDVRPDGGTAPTATARSRDRRKTAHNKLRRALGRGGGRMHGVAQEFGTYFPARSVRGVFSSVSCCRPRHRRRSFRCGCASSVPCSDALCG